MLVLRLELFLNLLLLTCLKITISVKFSEDILVQCLFKSKYHDFLAYNFALCFSRVFISLDFFSSPRILYNFNTIQYFSEQNFTTFKSIIGMSIFPLPFEIFPQGFCLMKLSPSHLVFPSRITPHFDLFKQWNFIKLSPLLSSFFLWTKPMWNHQRFVLFVVFALFPKIKLHVKFKQIDNSLINIPKLVREYFQAAAWV